MGIYFEKAVELMMRIGTDFEQDTDKIVLDFIISTSAMDHKLYVKMLEEVKKRKNNTGKVL